MAQILVIINKFSTYIFQKSDWPYSIFRLYKKLDKLLVKFVKHMSIKISVCLFQDNFIRHENLHAYCGKYLIVRMFCFIMLCTHWV